MSATSNRLIHSTSPYLLQHAHNPVDWQEWGTDALDQAKKEDKPILVSIGYSSCHWCHVMEKESFEDVAVAELMNAHFINIKVDREERPDVDQIYMDAVHAMGLQGGWPLNVFLTPDQKPFYGGTYFPRNGWMNLLSSIHNAYQTNRIKLNESAEAFTKTLQAKESEKYKLNGTDHQLSEEEATSLYSNLSAKFDPVDGGIKKSPKFPMPSVWQLLATYCQASADTDALQHFEFTLEKMADGGIYDHIGGGFARYSTDEEWHVPHFEKMLYDNGQLLSLFATGYQLTGKPKFKQTILETIAWAKRELLSPEGGFYAALDADSEGVEGKYYVWSQQEIEALAGTDASLIKAYYDVLEDGNWEGANVLRVIQSEETICKEFNVSLEEFKYKIDAFKEKARVERNKRVRPGLDDKIIAGWNGLMLTGITMAYQATGEETILDLAKSNAKFIRTHLLDGAVLRRFPNKSMEGFMEDYAAIIQSFIIYYQTTFDREFLELAHVLTKRVNQFFFDPKEGLYYFTGDTNSNLIARKQELFDNVIPASNSLMTWNLVHLGTLLYDDELLEQGKSMLAKVKPLVVQEPEYLSQWGLLAIELSRHFAEVVIVGPEAIDFAKALNASFLPNKVIAASNASVQLPPFEGKKALNEATTIYVCFDKSCKQPVHSPAEAMKQMLNI